MKRRLIVALLVVLALAGCTSPEDARTSGSGPGGDIGNYGEDFKPASKVFNDRAPSDQPSDQLYNFSSNEGR